MSLLWGFFIENHSTALYFVSLKAFLTIQKKLRAFRASCDIIFCNLVSCTFEAIPLSKLRKSLNCTIKLQQITEHFQFWQRGDANHPQYMIKNLTRLSWYYKALFEWNFLQEDKNTQNTFNSWLACGQLRPKRYIGILHMHIVWDEFCNHYSKIRLWLETLQEWWVEASFVTIIPKFDFGKKHSRNSE